MNLPRYGLFFGGLFGAVVLLLVPMAYENNMVFWDRLLDAGHVPLFTVFTLWLAWSNPLGLVPRRHCHAFAIVAALVFAALTEIVQPLTGRTESFVDFRNGAFGIALAALLLRAGGRGPVFHLCAAAFTLVVVVWSVQPAFRLARAIEWRRAAFPLLASFESENEMPLWLSTDGWETNRVPYSRALAHATHGDWSLQVRTPAADFPGVRMTLDEQNWSAHHTLAFDIFNPGQPFTLGIKINDHRWWAKLHERYNGAFPIRTGSNQIRIPIADIRNGPKTEPLDLHRVRMIAFFLDHPRASQEFYIDRLRLEK